jgi:hypothetical protein
MEITLDQLIDKLEKLPEETTKKIVKKQAHYIQGMVADRVLNLGVNADGKKMIYAPSTITFKKKTGRDHTKKIMAHSRNRIWSSHGVIQNSYNFAYVGWRKGSEGFKLAMKNQRRDNFHGLTSQEFQKLAKNVNEFVKNGIKKLFK